MGFIDGILAGLQGGTVDPRFMKLGGMQGGPIQQMGPQVAGQMANGGMQGGGQVPQLPQAAPNPLANPMSNGGNPVETQNLLKMMPFIGGI